MQLWRYVVIAVHTAASMLASTNAMAGQISTPTPLVILEQGSFAVGGKVVTAPGTFDPRKPQTPAGQTYHGDHAYVFYQIPVDARKYPLVMWHGYGQFSKTWETTPDGREGFQTIFLRRRFPVYLIDQPRRGDAGRSTVETTIKPTPDEQFWFGQFRVGVWPNYFDGVQFSHDPEALNQYFRQMTPDTGPFDIDVMSDAVSALFTRIGRGILVTHSHSGGLGWSAAMKNENIKAIVSFEPGSNFVFPAGEVPDPMPSAFDTLQGIPVPMSDFMALTRIPIIIFTEITSPTSHPISKRDRSLATVSALVTMNRPDQLRSHLALARRNGVTEEELVEAITHLAFYAGWPNAVTAIQVAKEVFNRN